MRKNTTTVRLPKNNVYTEGFRKGSVVKCLTDGTSYTSAKACAQINHMTYANFIRVLREGKKATDGKWYCYKRNLAYYEDVIDELSYERAKENCEMAKRKYEVAKHIVENLEKERN